MKPRNLALILLIAIVVLTVSVGSVFAQETNDVFETLELRFIILGISAGVLYAFLGWDASGEEFEPKKFVRTIVIVSLATLGLDISGMTFDIYSALLEPTMITIFLEKLLNSASRRSTKG